MGCKMLGLRAYGLMGLWAYGLMGLWAYGLAYQGVDHTCSWPIAWHLLEDDVGFSKVLSVSMTRR